MDFAFLPPEINSTRLYAGPGSGLLLSAAESWDSLSAELRVAARAYESVISDLTGLYWRGPASEAMSTTAATYIGWLYTSAEQAMQTALQARAAAAAYELAHALTLPPAAVMANRTQLALLIATNFFGQNTAAIAATEAQYAEYWAQDAAAMYGYAISSAMAAQLTPFPSPHQATNPAGLSAQSSAVAQANASADATNSASQVISATTPTTAAGPSPFIPEAFSILDVIEATRTTMRSIANMEGVASGVIGAEDKLGILPKPAAPAAEIAQALSAAPSGASSGLGGGAGLGSVDAALARAGTVGSMSVPASWAAPPSSPVTALSDGHTPILPENDGLAASRSGIPGMPGMPARTIKRATLIVPRYGARLTVMARPPAAG